MCKKIVIDATGGQTYGSKFHIKSFVEHFSNHNKSDELIIYLKDDYLSIKQKNIKIIIVPSAKIKFIRILFSTFILPILCLFKNYNTIYYPFDVGSFIPIKTRIILGIKNPNLILPKELITLKFSAIHKLVSKISSCFANILLFPSNTALNQISTHLFDVKQKEFIYHGLDFSDWTNNFEDKHNNDIKSKYPKHLKYVYGKGLLAALIFIDENNNPLSSLCDIISEKAFQKGLLVVHTGRESIKLAPPLSITKEALLEGLEVIEECIKESI